MLPDPTTGARSGESSMMTQSTASIAQSSSRAPQATHSSKPGERGSVKQRNGRILVVDDDLDHAQMLADVLASSGFRATPVGGAREAMKHVEAGEVDVVVTDLRMPEMGGLELIDWCTKQDPRLVVVAI